MWTHVQREDDLDQRTLRFHSVWDIFSLLNFLKHVPDVPKPQRSSCWTHKVFSRSTSPQKDAPSNVMAARAWTGDTHTFMM